MKSPIGTLSPLKNKCVTFLHKNLHLYTYVFIYFIRNFLFDYVKKNKIKSNLYSIKDLTIYRIRFFFVCVCVHMVTAMRDFIIPIWTCGRIALYLITYAVFTHETCCSAQSHRLPSITVYGQFRSRSILCCVRVIIIIITYILYYIIWT